MNAVARFVIASVLASLPCALLAAPAKVAGEWAFTVELSVGTGHPTVTIKQDGEKLAGSYQGRYGASPLEGTVKDTKIELKVAMTSDGAPVTVLFSGVVDGETMSGSVNSDQIGDGTWRAARAAAK